MEENFTQRVSRRFYVIASAIMIIISFIRYESVYRFGYGVSDVQVRAASAFMLIMYLFAIYSWIRVTRRYVSPYFMFLAACFLFNAGQMFLYLFNLSNSGFFNVFNYYSLTSILRMIYFQALCVAMLNIGALIGVNQKIKNVYANGFVDKESKKGRYFSFSDIVFTLSSGYLILTYFMRIVFRIESSYTDAYLEYGADGGSYLVATITFIFHITYFYGLYNNFKSTKKNYYYVIGAIWLVLLLLVGGRFKLVPLIAGTVVIAYMKREAQGKYLGKAKTILLVVLGVFAFSLMEGFATIRDRALSSINMDLLLSVYSEGFWENLFATISETGASARCIISTMQYVDDGMVTNEPSFLYALANGILPGSVLNGLGFTMNNLSLSAWITNLAGSKNGWGYSVFAECYYNLSEFGFICMFFFGFAMVRLEALSIRLIRTELPYEQLLGCGILFILVDAIFLSRANMLLISPDIRRTMYIFIIGALIQRKIRTRIPESPYVQNEETAG